MRETHFSLKETTIFIEHGADVNVPDSEGNALLPLAAKAGQLEVVQLLLDAGADANGTLATSTYTNLRGTALNLSALTNGSYSSKSY